MSKEQPPMPKRLLVDFDNTLSDTVWTGEKWAMGVPIVPVVEAVQKASATHEIVIFTARPVSEWDEMRKWLAVAKVPYSSIFLKPLGTIIDDHSLRPEEFVERSQPKQDTRGITEIWESYDPKEDGLDKV